MSGIVNGEVEPIGTSMLLRDGCFILFHTFMER